MFDGSRGSREPRNYGVTLIRLIHVNVVPILSFVFDYDPAVAMSFVDLIFRDLVLLLVFALISNRRLRGLGIDNDAELAGFAYHLALLQCFRIERIVTRILEQDSCEIPNRGSGLHNFWKVTCLTQEACLTAPFQGSICSIVPCTTHNNRRTRLRFRGMICRPILLHSFHLSPDLLATLMQSFDPKVYFSRSYPVASSIKI